MHGSTSYRLFAIAALALLMLASMAFGQNWRQSKLALLSPADQPLTPYPAPKLLPNATFLFGDSRVAQWTPLPKNSVRLGFSGESAIRLAPEFARALNTHHPRSAVLMLGVNDAVAASLLSDSERTATLAQTLAAFESMAKAAQARNVPLTILAVTPPIRPDPFRRLIWRGRVLPYVEAVNAALPAIAHAHGAHFAQPPMPDARGRADTLHFTPSHYRALNKWLEAAAG